MQLKQLLVQNSVHIYTWLHNVSAKFWALVPIMKLYTIYFCKYALCVKIVVLYQLKVHTFQENWPNEHLSEIQLAHLTHCVLFLHWFASINHQCHRHKPLPVTYILRVSKIINDSMIQWFTDDFDTPKMILFFFLFVGFEFFILTYLLTTFKEWRWSWPNFDLWLLNKSQWISTV